LKKSIIALALVAGAVGLVILVAAWTGESSETAKKNFCNSLSSFSSTVVSYEGLNPATATNEQLDNAADDIATAWDDVLDEANDWVNADDNALTEAYDDLYYATQDLPGDYTIAQDLDSLQPELDAVAQAYSETFTGAGCTV
jgi:hypothetical protein